MSGAVFEVDASPPHVDVDSQTLWFCRGGCAAYFEAHRDEVLDPRGMRSGGHASASGETDRVGG